jgi:N-acetylglutamate synthase-like GNAT family acetyltransferase
VAAFEKQFYLRSFRDRSILFCVSDQCSALGLPTLTAELAANGTLVIVVAAKFPRGVTATKLTRAELAGTGAGLVEVGSELLAGGVAHVRRPPRLSGARGLEFAGDLALRLGVHKMVVVDPRGGLRTASGARSFLTVTAAARLARNDAPADGWKPSEIKALVRIVRDGLDSINVTTVAGAGDELFTYQGAGTLLTSGEYCHVEKLRVDDFAQANTLLDRGEREGFLLPRDAAARGRLLLGAFGAWFEGRLAGIASLELEAYRRERAAEIVGLYTITRFVGEGVGVRMIAALVEAAAARGFTSIFACTSNERAARFFARNGFEPVAPDQVPKRKWRRREGEYPAVFCRQLVRRKPR